MASGSYFCAPLKLVPLSDGMCLTFPQRAIKRHIAKMKEPVVRSPAISKYMACFVMQVNIFPYFLAFSWLEPVLVDSFTIIGPKKSILAL